MSCDITHYSLLRKRHTIPKTALHKTMFHSYIAVICENQLSSSAATAVALRADGVCGLMLAKLRILHMRAGTLLQAAL